MHEDSLTDIHKNESIKRVLDYIEQNLTDELPLSVLAQTAGYSKYHFLRLFKEIIGITPADYIRKRRLSEVAMSIPRTNGPVSDIAFAKGFNSKENFTRAFAAEHGIPPTAYKSTENSLKLYIPSDAVPEVSAPALLTLVPFSLTVYPDVGTYPPKFWNKYNAGGYSARLSGGAVCEDFGVCRWNAQENRLAYWIGIRTDHARGDTTGTELLQIPGGLYAVFTTPPATQFDFVNTIHHTWEVINRVWLPKSGFRQTGGYAFECYTEKSRLFSEKIFVPIEKDITD